MKICPYCGRMSKDSATRCEKCKAGFSSTEPVKETEKTVKVKRQFRNMKEDKE